MAKGGKRIGAGRPKGSAHVKTRAIADREAKSGEKLPLEVMLDNMRAAFKNATDAEKVLAEITPERLGADPEDPKAQFDALLAEVKKAVGLRAFAQECAKDAARFMHAILAPVDARSQPNADVVPLVDRLKSYARRDAIEQSEGKVIALKR